nr:MAG TPA: hypothetical protein [Caudoviricetes sp.]
MEHRADIFVIIVECENQFQPYRITVKRNDMTTIEQELIKTGYCYRDNEDGSFDVCYDHNQDAFFAGLSMCQRKFYVSFNSIKVRLNQYP